VEVVPGLDAVVSGGFELLDEEAQPIEFSVAKRQTAPKTAVGIDRAAYERFAANGLT